MQAEEWLGQDNQLGCDIWKKKYCYDNETFDHWLDRISGGNEKIARLIREKKFLFGGRILSNRGLEYEGRKITLSNCYVIEPPQDDIESIFECSKKLARTYSYGGGCGEDQQCGQGDDGRGILYGAVFAGYQPDRSERKKRRADDFHRLLPSGCGGVH